MTLLSPWFLVLLPLPWLIRRIKRPNNNALEVPKSLALYWRDASGSSASRRTILYAIWVLLVIALARPVIARGEPIYPVQARDIVLAIDLSASMEREDFSIDGKTASRIEVVRQVASQFVRSLEHERVAIVFFADEAFIATPLSFDMSANASFIEEAKIGLAGRSTAIGDAIGQSLKVFDFDTETNVPRFIILLSDGTNNAGAVSPLQASTLANTYNVKIFTIGLASDEFTNSLGINRAANYDLDEKTLKAMAAQTNGAYFRARNTAELDEIYNKLAEVERGDVEAPPLVRYYELNWVLVMTALLSMLFIPGVVLSTRQ